MRYILYEYKNKIVFFQLKIEDRIFLTLKKMDTKDIRSFRIRCFLVALAIPIFRPLKILRDAYSFYCNRW